MYDYSEKLKHPKWQKKRLKILEREGWKCQACGDTESTLQVHHLIYSKGQPWDAPDETLECLCEVCHQMREDLNEVFDGRSMMPTKFVFEMYYLLQSLFNGTANVPKDWFITKDRWGIKNAILDISFRLWSEKTGELDPAKATVVPNGTSPAETSSEQVDGALVNQQMDRPNPDACAGVDTRSPVIPGPCRCSLETDGSGGQSPRSQQTSAIA